MKGCITVQDIKKARASTMEILGVDDVSAMVSLAQGLQSYTRGNMMEASVTIDEKLTLPAASDGPYCLANQKAVLTFRDLDATGTKGTAMVLRIPCPNEIIFEKGDNGDYVVIQAQGTAIASMINNRLGRNVEFVRGFLWNKKRKG